MGFRLHPSNPTGPQFLCFHSCAEWIPRFNFILFSFQRERKVRGSNQIYASRLSLSRLGNLTLSQPLCFCQVAWQLGTERVLQLNILYKTIWKKTFSCNALPASSCHATQKKHEGWGTSRLSKPRQGSRGAEVGTSNLAVRFALLTT
ncbi:LOW QUALITY PROTEIN: hypothetical protein T265_14087 [Opisthorchis viverrini]|uniref:Uncharacterized protein n=1 Tax=Opisthorchis viverrini TaxID=6198 RepID=A0A075ADH1_OPIVI|nr:LOW QUALITY PROTEIN: hypothetical protein T265_14087 [Opisthorchis viverrini]KER26059.1 LOW QUALITY PROTEIN: hypothetical protein T265_14087 [Opisthorchis viverrini]